MGWEADRRLSLASSRAASLLSSGKAVNAGGAGGGREKEEQEEKEKAVE